MARKLPVYPSDSASLQFSGLGCFVLVSLVALRGFAFAQVTDSLGGVLNRQQSPSGRWSYGCTTSLGGAFVADAIPTAIAFGVTELRV
jgi:hypothetical protein